MKVYQMVQTSPEWWAIRRGIPTASEFNRIITARDGRLSKGYRKYLAELLSHAAMADAAYFSTRGVWRGTQAMQDGREAEGEGRAWYAMQTNLHVQQVGFCMADAGTYGCSPDGVIGLHMLAGGRSKCEGLLELKCPTLHVQFERLLHGGLPLEYRVQCHGQLAVTGAAWVDWCSYAIGAQGLIVRVEPDEYTERVRQAVEEFVAELIREAKRLGVMLGASEPALVPAGEMEPF